MGAVFNTWNDIHMVRTDKINKNVFLSHVLSNYLRSFKQRKINESMFDNKCLATAINYIVAAF